MRCAVQAGVDFEAGVCDVAAIGGGEGGARDVVDEFPACNGAFAGFTWSEKCE